MNKQQHLEEDMEQQSFEAFTKCKSVLFGAKVRLIIQQNDLQNVIMTLLLIIGSNILYLVFIFPESGFSIFAIICIVIGFSPIFTLLNVTMTGEQQIYLEPGVLLKGDLPQPEQPEKPQDTEANQIEIVQQNISISKVVPLDTDQPRIYIERYCATCKIMRPSKASHCKQCNHCVDGFDHHCFWVGNCIGIRNLRAFNIFLLSATTATLFVGIQCIINRISNQLLVYSQSGLMYDLWLQMFGDGSIPILSFYGLYFILGCWTIQSILNVLLIIVMFFLPLIYSYTILNIDYADLRYYENPYMTALVLLFFFVHFLFAFSTCCVNWFHAALGKTAKQISSEAEYYMRKNQPISHRNVSLAQICQNLLQFLTYTIPQSRYQ